MRPLIYIAGPIAKGHPLDNFTEPLKVAANLASMGYAPLVPHWHNLSLSVVVRGDNPFWMDLDRTFVHKADALFRLKGESKGADQEVAWAQERGIPVFTRTVQALEWIEGMCPGCGHRDSKGDSCGCPDSRWPSIKGEKKEPSGK